LSIFFFNYHPYFKTSQNISQCYFFEPLIVAPNLLLVAWLEIPGIPNELFQVAGNQTPPGFPIALSLVD